MKIEQISSNSRNQLNPFVLPAATTTRFILMIMAVLSATLFVYQYLFLTLNKGHLTPEFVIGSIGATARWGVYGLAGVLTLAFLVYFFMPSILIKRWKLVALEADYPDIVIYLKELTKEMGIGKSSDLQYLWNPLKQTPDGRAFGRIGRYYIALNGGLVMQFYTDRDTFRAKILHELAHLKNKDISITFFTMSVWYAFAAVGIIPFVFFTIAKGSELLLGAHWRMAVLTGTIFFIRNSILRTREVYADLTAAGREGVREVLIRSFRISSDSSETGRLAAYFRKHPEPSTRILVLNDNRSLFETSIVEAFVLGFLTTMPIPVFEDSFGMLLNGSIYQLANSFVAALLVIPFTVFVIGSSVWKRAYLTAMTGQPVCGIKRLGIFLGIGLMAGEVLQLNSSLGLSEFGLGSGEFNFVSLAFWLSMMLIFAVILVRWLYAYAKLFLPRAVDFRTPRWFFYPVLVVTTCTFTFFFGLLVRFKIFL